MLRSMSSVRNREGGHVFQVKIVVPPPKKKNLSWADAKTSPPPHSDKYRKKLNVFLYALLVGTDCGDTFQHRLSCSHYGFLRKLVKNNLFSAPITEQFIFHQHYNTLAVSFKR